MIIQEQLDNLPLPGIAKDIIFVAIVVGTISLLSQIAVGLWTPMVAVESGSMVPNLNIGDIIIIQGISRTTAVTYEEGEKTGYSAFNKPGDVILYRPYGKESMNLFDQLKMLIGISPGQDKATPIIHRALYRVKQGEPMWQGGPAAPFDGFITKGDHNDKIDQMAGQIFGIANMNYIEKNRDEIKSIGSNIFLDKGTGAILYKTTNGTFVGEGISYLTPVKDEWVIGVARVKIPYVGYVRLLPSIILDEIRKIL
jgi:signal peptidase